MNILFMILVTCSLSRLWSEVFILSADWRKSFEYFFFDWLTDVRKRFCKLFLIETLEFVVWERLNFPQNCFFRFCYLQQLHSWHYAHFGNLLHILFIKFSFLIYFFNSIKFISYLTIYQNVLRLFKFLFTWFFLSSGLACLYDKIEEGKVIKSYSSATISFWIRKFLYIHFFLVYFFSSKKSKSKSRGGKRVTSKGTAQLLNFQETELAFWDFCIELHIF